MRLLQLHPSANKLRGPCRDRMITQACLLAVHSCKGSTRTKEQEQDVVHVVAGHHEQKMDLQSNNARVCTASTTAAANM